MNRSVIAKFAAALLTVGAIVPTSKVFADEYQQGFGQRRQVIPWSWADYRPEMPRNNFTGIYIWHDRNTVHVTSTDNQWFGDSFDGVIEITHGKFDNVYKERGGIDTHLHQIARNKIAFHFSSHDTEVDAFKFNLNGGDKIIFHLGMNGRRTGRIFYGAQRQPTFEDPAVFNLNK